MAKVEPFRSDLSKAGGDRKGLAASRQQKGAERTALAPETGACQAGAAEADLFPIWTDPSRQRCPGVAATWVYSFRAVASPVRDFMQPAARSFGDSVTLLFRSSAASASVSKCCN